MKILISSRRTGNSIKVDVPDTTEAQVAEALYEGFDLDAKNHLYGNFGNLIEVFDNTYIDWNGGTSDDDYLPLVEAELIKTRVEGYWHKEVRHAITATAAAAGIFTGAHYLGINTGNGYLDILIYAVISPYLLYLK